MDNLKLSDEKELVQQFRVPEGLRHVTATLQVSVERVVGENQELSASTMVATGGVDTGSELRLPFLEVSPTRGYAVRVLGKAGEACADVGVSIYLRHAFHRVDILKNLTTDATGRVELGWLKNIAGLKVVRGPECARVCGSCTVVGWMMLMPRCGGLSRISLRPLAFATPTRCLRLAFDRLLWMQSKTLLVRHTHRPPPLSYACACSILQTDPQWVLCLVSIPAYEQDPVQFSIPCALESGIKGGNVVLQSVSCAPQLPCLCSRWVSTP